MSFLSAPVSAAPGARQSIHRHGEARLVVYLGGEMEESSFEGASDYVSGDFVFRPAFFAHADDAGPRGSRYARLALSLEAVRMWVRHHGWRAARGRVEIGRALHGDDVLGTARARPYAPISDGSAMQRAAHWLTSHDAPRIRDVAHKLGFAPYDLSRRFMARFGLAPAVYRRQARLQAAMGLIVEGGSSLPQIAAAVGFHDQSHMTTELKRETGLTPGAFARKHGC